MFDVDIFKRNIKLQELGIDKLSNREQDILDFLNEHLTNLNIYTSIKYTDGVFYGKSEDNIVLEYNKQDGLYVSYDKIWLIIGCKFDIERDDLNVLMAWWVGDMLNLDVYNKIYPYNFYDEDIKHLKPKL